MADKLTFSPKGDNLMTVSYEEGALAFPRLGELIRKGTYWVFQAASIFPIFTADDLDQIQKKLRELNGEREAT